MAYGETVRSYTVKGKGGDGKAQFGTAHEGIWTDPQGMATGRSDGVDSRGMLETNIHGPRRETPVGVPWWAACWFSTVAPDSCIFPLPMNGWQT